MTCPLCRTGSLVETVEDGLRLHRCASCAGCWIESDDHLAWTRATWPTGDQRRDLSSPVEVGWEQQQELDPAKPCPRDGHVLRKYAVGGTVGFRIDHCATCGGAWLDPGEWAELGRRRLQDDLQSVFTQAWQEAARALENRRADEQLLLERFGPDDLQRLREVKRWIDGLDQRGAALAFLADGRLRYVGGP